MKALDHFLISNIDIVSYYDVLDPDLNLSDHRPITINCRCHFAVSDVSVADRYQRPDCEKINSSVKQLRWDHCNTNLYCELTGLHLRPVLHELIKLENGVESTVNSDHIYSLYDRIVNVLNNCADVAVPACPKNFFKYWWDDEMNDLKSRSIDSCKIWKAAGRPRSGPIFDLYKKDKSAYRYGIRARRITETEQYTNDLHDALLKKNGKQFWRCWDSKFEHRKQTTNYVNGITDPIV